MKSFKQIEVLKLEDLSLKELEELFYEKASFLISKTALRGVSLVSDKVRLRDLMKKRTLEFIKNGDERLYDCLPDQGKFNDLVRAYKAISRVREPITQFIFDWGTTVEGFDFWEEIEENLLFHKELTTLDDIKEWELYRIEKELGCRVYDSVTTKECEEVIDEIMLKIE